MAEKCFPLENTEYTAADAQMWFAARTSGVYAGTHLPVSADGTMNLTVGSGIAWLHYDQFAGCVYGNTENRTLTVGMSDAALDRIDRVCIRLEVLKNRCYSYIKQGVPSSVPEPPALQRNNVAYEISIAQVLVRVGVVGINAGDITDERLDADVCGLMSDGVTGIDTSVIQAQFESFLRELRDGLTEFKETEQAAFEEWFAEVRNILDGDTAGNLLNKINTKMGGYGVSLTIPVDGWSGEGPYTQELAVTGVTADSTTCHLFLSDDPAQEEAFANAGCKLIAQNTDSVTMRVEKIPETEFTANLLVVFQGVSA